MCCRDEFVIGKVTEVDLDRIDKDSRVAGLGPL